MIRSQLDIMPLCQISNHLTITCIIHIQIMTITSSNHTIYTLLNLLMISNPIQIPNSNLYMH